MSSNCLLPSQGHLAVPGGSSVLASGEESDAGGHSSWLVEARVKCALSHRTPCSKDFASPALDAQSSHSL